MHQIASAKHKILNDEKVTLKKPQNFQLYIFKNHLYQLHGLFTLTVRRLGTGIFYAFPASFGYDQIEYYIIEALTGTLFSITTIAPSRHAGVFRGARFERRAPLKMRAWEANQAADAKKSHK